MVVQLFVSVLQHFDFVNTLFWEIFRKIIRKGTSAAIYLININFYDKIRN